MQRTNFLILSFLILMYTVSCNTAGKTDKTTNDKEQVVDTMSFEQIEKNISEEQQAEIYQIEKKAVIFFMIDRQEANRMVQELGDSYRWDTDAMFNAFVEQSKTFGNLIRKHHIKSELAFNKKFQITLNDSSSIFFDREAEDQIMGEILTDGEKKPQIKFGMYTSRELAKLVQEFFDIENLGYIPPDTLENKEQSEEVDSLGL